jgi:hypothetical protein
LERLLAFREEDLQVMQQLLFTKYHHWRYENEARSLVALKDRDPEKNMYFAAFSGEFKLAQVIVGAKSKLTREAVRAALGDLAPSAELIKARLSFKSFRVVRQRSQKLWI